MVLNVVGMQGRLIALHPQFVCSPYLTRSDAHTAFFFLSVLR